MKVYLTNREYRITQGNYMPGLEASISFQCYNEEALNNIIGYLESVNSENGLPENQFLQAMLDCRNKKTREIEVLKDVAITKEIEQSNVSSNSIDGLEI